MPFCLSWMFGFFSWDVGLSLVSCFVLWRFSGWTADVRQWEDPSMLFCWSSSLRKASHTDMCCTTRWKPHDNEAGALLWDWRHQQNGPCRVGLCFSVLGHCSFISFILVCTCEVCAFCFPGWLQISFFVLQSHMIWDTEHTGLILHHTNHCKSKSRNNPRCFHLPTPQPTVLFPVTFFSVLPPLDPNSNRFGLC